jgi:hypothetical protein
MNLLTTFLVGIVLGVAWVIVIAAAILGIFIVIDMIREGLS